MALIAKCNTIFVVSEDKHLKDPYGWKAEGGDVFTRCAWCHKITRICDVEPAWKDGRGTCAMCHHCKRFAFYIFAGWGSEYPPYKPGRYTVTYMRGIERIEGEACPCGGTVLGYTSSMNHCLSCGKKVT